MSNETDKRRSLNLDKAESLESVLAQAIGAASGCWTNLRGAGIFESDRAKAILDELVAEVNERTAPPRLGRSAVIREMTEEVYQNAFAHGWYDKDRTFGDEVALLHSEISEMFEAWREVGMEPRNRPLKHDALCAFHTNSPCDKGCVAKPEDVASEAADEFIRLLDFCRRYDIDLAYEYERKMRYNRTRPYLHGGRKI